MGSSTECGSPDDGDKTDTHHLCRATWCDCGCHHAALDAHFDGAHYDEPDPFCQVCAKVAGGAEPYCDNTDRPAPAWAR